MSPRWLFALPWLALGCQQPLTVYIPDETGPSEDAPSDAASDATVDAIGDSFAPKDSADAGDALDAIDAQQSDGDAFDPDAVETDGQASEVASDGPAPDTDVPWDGAIVCDAGADASDAPPPPVGTRFCEIYVDLMSPTSVAKCQSSGCHGGKVGVVGFAMGWTGKECYDALTTHKVSWLAPYRVVEPVPGGDSRPKSLLPKVIDPSADAGILMPWMKEDSGNRLLNDGERARIDTWLSRGAPFD